MKNYKEYKAIIVEDDPIFARVEEQTLVRFGFDRSNITTCDSIAGVKSLKEETLLPELIILDLNLTDSSGISTLFKVRELYPEQFIIVLSAVDTSKLSSDFESSLSKNHFDFIQKEDFNTLSLSKTIAKNLEKNEIHFAIEEELCFHTFFTESDQPKCIVDSRSWTLTRVNDKWASFFHQSEEELKGRKLGEICNISENELKLLELVDRRSFSLNNRKLKSVKGNIANIDLQFTYLFQNQIKLVFVSLIDRTAEFRNNHEKLNNLSIRTEKERNKIANELHDAVSPLLSTSLNFIAEILSDPDKNQTDLLHSIRDNIGLAHQLCKDMSYELAAPPIHSGLLISLELLFERLREGNEIQFKLFKENDVNDEILSRYDIYSIYKIVSEFCENAIQHSQGENVICSLSTSGDALHILLSDDGIGFNPSTVKKGVGLKEIEDRVQFSEGEYTYHTFPGKGTSLKIKLYPNNNQLTANLHSFTNV